MKSIRTKILIQVLSGIVFISLVIGFFLMSQTKSAYSKEAYKTFEHVTTKYVTEYNKELSNLERTGYAIKLLVESLFDMDAYLENENYLDEFEDMIAPSIKRFAKETLKDHSAYVFFDYDLDNDSHDVWYSDNGGNGSVVRQPETKASFYKSENETKLWYFEPKQSHEPYWSLPFDGVADFNQDVYFVSRTYPIMINGQFFGVAGADYFFDSMSSDIQNISIQKSGYAVLIDNTGNFIVNPKQEDSVLKTYVKQWSKEIKLNAGSGIKEFKSDNQLNYFVYDQLKNGWTFGIIVRHDELFKWYYDLNFRVIILILFAIVGMGLIVIEVSRSISKPIVELTSNVMLIASGDYEHTIPTENFVAAEETFVLASNIENMRVLQVFSFDKLKEQNKHLEQEVHERTESLNKNTQSLENTLNLNLYKKDELLKRHEALEVAIQNMKATQKQLVESERLASLSYIVTRMAHEFNTPIGSFITILTFLESQKHQIDVCLLDNTLTLSQLKKFFNQFDMSYEMIEKNLEQMNVLIKRFEVLDNQEETHSRTRVNMFEFLNVVLNSMDYNKDKIAVNIICDKNIEVEVETGKLSQIFIHLFENAVIHGFSRRRNGQVDIRIDKNNDNLFITIEDDGLGMSTEQVQQMFIPFYSGDLSNKTGGLGLNIVYNLVTKVFDGQIMCKSELDKGTVVEMILKLN